MVFFLQYEFLCDPSDYLPQQILWKLLTSKGLGKLFTSKWFLSNMSTNMYILIAYLNFYQMPNNSYQIKYKYALQFFFQIYNFHLECQIKSTKCMFNSIKVNTNLQIAEETKFQMANQIKSNYHC